jgi:hypothetical protein
MILIAYDLVQTVAGVQIGVPPYQKNHGADKIFEVANGLADKLKKITPA